MIRKGCFLLLLVTGCALAQPIPDTRLTLQTGASAVLAPDTTLTLERVEDSRCPPQAMCIRKGGLAYRFLLHTPNGEEGFTLSAEAPARQPARLPGVRIALGEPDPDPTHSVTILISHP